MRLIARTADLLYHAALTELIVSGDRSAPRGRGTRERLAAHLTLTNPDANIITLRERKLNYAFMIAEWLYIMSGGNYADLITPFNRNIGPFAEDGRFAGAYGPKVLEQLPYILQTLRRDPHSRQAVLTIWRERPRDSKDVPCTVMLQFFLRDDGDLLPPGDGEVVSTRRARRLHAIVYMRSNDAWLGLPYDIFNFTQLQRYIAHQLGVPCGHYHHMVGSLHLYDDNHASAVRVVNVENPTLTIEQQQAPFASAPVLLAVGALFDIAIARQGVEPQYVGGWGELDDQWRGYIEVLCWRFNKKVLPRHPWYILTANRDVQVP